MTPINPNDTYKPVGISASAELISPDTQLLKRREIEQRKDDRELAKLESDDYWDERL